MQKIDNVRVFYKNVVIQTEGTEDKKPVQGYKKIAEKLILVKNNIISYLTHTKTQYIKSIKHLIFSLKSVRSEKSRSPWTAQQDGDGIVLISHKTVLDPAEQFENDMAEHLTKLNEEFQKEITDENYKEQVIDAIFSAIYRDVKVSFEIYCYYNKPDMLGARDTAMPKDYLKTIGQAAYDWGVACNEKDGIYIPKGAGANPLLNGAISILQKKYPIQINNQRNIGYINNEINTMVDKYSVASGLKSPLAFKSALMEITENWQRNINKENSTNA